MQRMAEKKKKMQLLHTKHIVLPNDIIIEILLRLPAKYLLRFRWACKYWFDLIANRNHQDFIKMHCQHSTSTIPSELSFCFTNRRDSYDKEFYQGYYLNYNNDTNYDLLPREVNRIGHQQIDFIYGILGSSNGLVLLMTKHLCILNPCTKEYKVLPRPLLIEGAYNRNLVTMWDTYGFGYDQTIDDYKVIRIKLYNLHGGDHPFDFDVQVYTLGKNSWRRIIGSNIPCRLQNCWSAPGVFLNGALYWMDYLRENIISFEIGKEKFQHVSKTPNLPTDDLLKLQVFEGSMCLLKINLNIPVEIWVMKDYTVNNNNNNESPPLWTKLLTIQHLDYPIKLLRYRRNSEILVLNNHKDLVLYDPKNTSYQTLSRDCEDCNNFSVLEVYIESLVSLNSGTYMDQ